MIVKWLVISQILLGSLSPRGAVYAWPVLYTTILCLRIRSMFRCFVCRALYLNSDRIILRLYEILFRELVSPCWKLDVSWEVICSGVFPWLELSHVPLLLIRNTAIFGATYVSSFRNWKSYQKLWSNSQRVPVYRKYRISYLNVHQRHFYFL